MIADFSAKDPSPQIRNKAVGIMKTATFAFQIPALVVALEDPSPQVRLTAGTNLAWIGLSDDLDRCRHSAGQPSKPMTRLARESAATSIS